MYVTTLQPILPSLTVLSSLKNQLSLISLYHGCRTLQDL